MCGSTLFFWSQRFSIWVWVLSILAKFTACERSKSTVSIVKPLLERLTVRVASAAARDRALSLYGRSRASQTDYSQPIGATSAFTPRAVFSGSGSGRASRGRTLGVPEDLSRHFFVSDTRHLKIICCTKKRKIESAASVAARVCRTASDRMAMTSIIHLSTAVHSS